MVLPEHQVLLVLVEVAEFDVVLVHVVELLDDDVLLVLELVVDEVLLELDVLLAEMTAGATHTSDAYGCSYMAVRLADLQPLLSTHELSHLRADESLWQQRTSRQADDGHDTVWVLSQNPIARPSWTTSHGALPTVLRSSHHMWLPTKPPRAAHPGVLGHP